MAAPETASIVFISLACGIFFTLSATLSTTERVNFTSEPTGVSI